MFIWGNIMKHLALATTAVLGLFSIATPVNASLFSWDVDYTGWWEEEGGGSVSGSFVADGTDAADGIVGLDEIVSWAWDWSGNDFVSAFSISSGDEGADIQVLEPAGFFVDGTTNEPDFFDGLDQGIFVGGNESEFILDLEFLTVEDNTVAFPFGGDLSVGDFEAASGSITVSDPTPVPEPATFLGLLALAGLGVTLKRRSQSA